MNQSLKEKAFKIVSTRNLCSYMNDTKWNELRWDVLNLLPFPPPYKMKTLFDDYCDEVMNFQEDVWYHGDWYEGLTYENHFNGYFAIEWIKVRPRYLKHRGQLIAPEMIDESKEFEQILKHHSIPFEMKNGAYCIYGYK